MKLPLQKLHRLLTHVYSGILSFLLQCFKYYFGITRVKLIFTGRQVGQSMKLQRRIYLSFLVIIHKCESIQSIVFTKELGLH